MKLPPQEALEFVIILGISRSQHPPNPSPVHYMEITLHHLPINVLILSTNSAQTLHTHTTLRLDSRLLPAPSPQTRVANTNSEIHSA